MVQNKKLSKHTLTIHYEIDYEALLEYFTFQNIFTDKTLVKNIKLFPPGHHATISTENIPNNLTLIQYWDFHFEEPTNPTKEEYIAELDRFISTSRQKAISQ